MTRDYTKNQQADAAEVQDQDGKAEIVQDKLLAEAILREDTQENERNPNDQPGFQDGIRGGWDGEDRQGEPNSVGGSDLEGEVKGGRGRKSSGGVDGGPERSGTF